MASGIATLVVAAGVAQAALASTPGSDPFLDVTQEVGLDFHHFNGMTGRLYYPEVVGAGGALFDADGDGDLDLYLVQGKLLGADRSLPDALLPWPSAEPLRDRLFRNDLEVTPGGERRIRFVDVTEESGIRATEYGMGAAVGDVDADGDLDLLVLNFGINQLWLNLGAQPSGVPRFELAPPEAGLDAADWSVAATFVDLDGDDLLDLYVTNYLEYSVILNKRCLTERGEPDYCLPGSYRPQADRLYRNTGAGHFRDVSVEAGIAAAPGNGLGVIAGDFDLDGRQDLYVANDLMPNQLWIHMAGSSRGPEAILRFVDDALMFGNAVNHEGKAEASMGVEFADLDADGDLDLFLTHYRRESNTLYQATEGGFFRDHSTASGLAAASWSLTGFGTAAIDYDLDADLDLAIANGAVTFTPGADRSRNPFPLDEPNQLFRNRGDGTFEEVLGDELALRGKGVSRGLLSGDLDNDGRVDLVVTNNSGQARVLINRQSPSLGWLGIELVPAHAAHGALVELLSPAEELPRQVRRVQRDGSYASARDPRVVLAVPSSPASVRVRWPNGTSEIFGGLKAQRYHALRRGEGEEEIPQRLD